MNVARLVLLFGTVLAGCAAEPVDPAGSRTSGIVDGAPSDEPAVVLLRDLARGGQCTGALISPRVILTAKHCVASQTGQVAPPRAVQVAEGSSAARIRRVYGVQEVRVAPGSFSINSRDGSDVALLILTAPAAMEPFEVNFNNPRELQGQRITAIGYGQTPAGNRVSQQYTTQKAVGSVFNGASVPSVYIQVQPAVCQGDSGGPLVGPDGKIWGVASFIVSPDGRSQPSCGPSPGFYNAIYHLQEWIEEAVEDSGVCIPDEEVCNGLDDDCDEEVDEGCTALGEPCTSSDECIGGLCDDTPAGRICTTECDPRTPAELCTLGQYCARTTGCEGRCVPQEEVETPLGQGEACTSDSQCESLLCWDPGDGNRRCLLPCAGDEGTCFASEVCVAPPGACGGCVAADLVAPPRNLGEPCTSDGECREGATCLDNRGVRYCAASCSDDSGCGDGYYCRSGSCVRGLRGGLGDGCVSNEDCGRGTICAVAGGRSWCTVLCTDSGDECPAENFRCTPAGLASVCEPSRALVGESCSVDEDCISRLCAAVGDKRMCTRFCGPDLACGPGLECVLTGAGTDTAVCLPPLGDDDGGGGCHVGVANPGHATLGGLLALSFLGLCWRRRR